MKSVTMNEEMEKKSVTEDPERDVLEIGQMRYNYKREGSPLHVKSYAFAVRIVRMFLHLTGDDAKLMVIYRQVLKSGTSISANVHESEFAQSSSDFVSKLSSALKEANETVNWLNLLKDTGYLTETEFDSMARDCSELIAMLVASINTVKRKIIKQQTRTTE